MKRILALLLALVALFLCSCQPTPDEEPVPNKGDDVMGEKIHTTPVPKTPDPKTPDPNTPEPGATEAAEPTDVPFVIPTIDVPEHWYEAYTMKCGTTLLIDSDIEFQNVAHPVYLIKDVDFDSAKVWQLMNYFSKDAKWQYREEGTSREELLEMLENILKGNVYIDENGNEVREPWPDEEEAKADVLRRLQELDPDGGWEDIDSLDDLPEGSMIFSSGERKYHVEQAGRNALNISSFGRDTLPISELGILQERGKLNPTMEKEEAIRLADEVIADLGLEDHFALSSVYVMRRRTTEGKKIGNDGWYVGYGLKVDGATMLDGDVYRFDGGIFGNLDNQTGEDIPEFAASIYEEVFKLWFEDGILISVRWNYPQELVSVENPAVELMPFDQIIERFKKRAEYGLSWRTQENCQDTILVDRIALTYVKTRKANAPDEYYYAPAWCFVVNDTTMELPVRPGAIMINAIDGTFIRRSY